VSVRHGGLGDAYGRVGRESMTPSRGRVGRKGRSVGH